MISDQNISRLLGADVVDADGDKIGSIGQIYVDPATGQPNWATVRTGFFGMSESFVPLDQADQVDGELRVPFTKDVVKDAPNIDPDGELSETEEDRLYDYYRGPGSQGYTGTEGYTGGQWGGTDRGADTDTTVGYDTSGPTTDDAMTRSEERLNVGTERVETGRARLRKYVVTEEQNVTVPRDS
jgi:sporulation protein YlmC with PRC-barrel domain